MSSNGAAYNPPSQIIGTYNPAYFSSSSSSSGSYLTIPSPLGIAQASKALTCDSNTSLTFPQGSYANGYIGFGNGTGYPSLLFYDTTNQYMMINTQANPSGRLEIFNSDTTFSNTLLNIRSLGVSGTLKLSLDASQTAGAVAINGWGSELNISSNASGSYAGTNNLLFSPSNGVIGINTLSPNNGMNLDIGGTTNSGKVHIATALVMGTQQTSNSTDWITALNGSMTNGSNNSFRIGMGLSPCNSFSMTFNYVSSGSTSNSISFQTYSLSNSLVIAATGYVGIGQSSPLCPLDVSGSASVTIVVGSTDYSVLTYTASTVAQLGPLTATISARFSNPIAATAFYATSDRRLKKEIKPLSLDYAKKILDCMPVSFKFKSDDDYALRQVGFIAQDLREKGLTNLLTFTSRKELKVEGEHDIEGCQMSIGYDRICVLNTILIKDLIKKIADLEEKVEKMGGGAEELDARA